MEAMTQEQRKKTKEALSRCGQKNWVYGLSLIHISEPTRP